MKNIDPKTFFTYWKNISEIQKEKAIENFNPRTLYTQNIKSDEDSICKQIAEKLELNFISEYYSIDTVFYDYVEDRYRYLLPGTWLKRIRIAFEHENDCTYAWQEVCHLCITNCDLRVLVTYVFEDPKELLADFCEIIESSTHPENLRFLIIFGYFHDGNFEWNSYSFNDSKWVAVT